MTTVHVAVAVIINQQNQVLIARRASHQHQGNKWEFPGGKVEQGETSKEALIREIKEEMGITIKSSDFMLDIEHEYDDIKVLLDVYSVDDWLGEAIGNEGQPIKWVNKQELHNYEFPIANAEILSLLSRTDS